MKHSPEFNRLRRLSARVGNDPLLVQAAGGNTSIKDDGVMWIKASGTWLKDAEAKDIFVPLDVTRLSAALAADDPACEACTDFVRADLNATGLRPSIETSVHGLMPQRVVVHVHCVNTIAFAIQKNGREQLAPRLQGFNWAWVPYARPGLMLARAIKAAMRPGVDVLVLGNHGLAVAAGTVADAEALLNRVVATLQLAARPMPQPDIAALSALAAGTSYRLPHDPACHGAALETVFAAQACSQVYYPDHVVFLGQSLTNDLNASAAAVAIPGAGVLIRNDAKPAVEPMVRCLADVFSRAPADAELKALTATEIDQLLNWDAEKYRQSLNAGSR